MNTFQKKRILIPFFFVRRNYGLSAEAKSLVTPLTLLNIKKHSFRV